LAVIAFGSWSLSSLIDFLLNTITRLCMSILWFSEHQYNSLVYMWLWLNVMPLELFPSWYALSTVSTRTSSGHEGSSQEIKWVITCVQCAVKKFLWWCFSQQHGKCVSPYFSLMIMAMAVTAESLVFDIQHFSSTQLLL
jgi:hypothetical protein